MFQRLLAAFALFVSLQLAAQATQSVGLAWDPSPDTDITTYRVYYGLSSGDRSSFIPVGNVTSAIVPNLSDGSTYFFVVTAVNTAALESEPSNEISYTTPGPAPTPTPTPPPSPTPSPNPTPGPSPSVSPAPSPTPTATPQPAAEGLSNISTRGYVQQGENVMIGGCTISGNNPKTVLIRGVGPSLLQSGVTQPLLNPVLALHDASGALVASGGPWDPRWTDAGPPPLDPREPVIRATLEEGNYTVVLSGSAGQSGTALIAIYDLNPATGRLAAMSTRGKVETHDDILIGGFIIAGSQPQRVAVRAIGPSLSRYGVQGALADSTLELYGGNGSLIYMNDNWRSDQEQQLIEALIAPTDDREAAIIATLPPGSYTAVVRGHNHTTGVALVEIYCVTPE